MSLRLRLMLILGLSSALLWGAASVWMLLDVRTEFRDALDERLAASARMVAGLVSQLPASPVSDTKAPPTALDVLAKEGVACEVRLIRGDLLVRTQDSPSGLGSVKLGFSTRTINGEQWRSYALEQDGKRITTADRIDKRQSLLHNIVLATVVPFLIAMFGGLIVLWLGIRQGLAPLESIRAALSRRGPDTLEPVKAAGVPPEISPLVDTLNALLERTRSAIERERRFTGDAAHELRTPLTAVKTHIQVAQLADGDETQKALENAELGVQRLERIVEQLLTLARVEGPFTFPGEDAATARQITELALNTLPASSRERVIVEDAASARRLGLPPMLAATALRNLLDNALRYSSPSTAVTLRLSNTDGYVAFSVLDEGKGLDEANRAFATQRFWRQGAGQGSGLGLSIVEAIVKRFGGELRLTARPEGGMIARIKLPSA